MIYYTTDYVCKRMIQKCLLFLCLLFTFFKKIHLILTCFCDDSLNFFLSQNFCAKVGEGHQGNNFLKYLLIFQTLNI